MNTIVLDNVAEEGLLVAQVKIVIHSVVNFKIAARLPQSLKVLSLLPLCPDEVAAVVHLLICVIGGQEVLAGGPSPPDSPLDDLPNEVEVVASTYEIVKVALPDHWLYAAVL